MALTSRDSGMDKAVVGLTIIRAWNLEGRIHLTRRLEGASARIYGIYQSFVSCNSILVLVCSFSLCIRVQRESETYIICRDNPIIIIGTHV